MSQNPKTYKAQIVKEANGSFEYIDVDWKDPEPNQLVIKVSACGVCHSDSIVKAGLMPVLPRIPGHEVVGKVVAVGSGVHNFKEGDYVGGGWHGYQCEECDPCRAGDFVTCQKQQINGVTMDGGYAEYTTLFANAAVHIPEGLDAAEAAPLLCAGVTVHNGMLSAGMKSGSLVAIQGIGGLGHLAIQYAAKMGYNTVALSTSDAKKDLASSLGASGYISGKVDAQVKALNDMGGADLIVCTAPIPDIIGPLMGALKSRGTLLLLAVPEGPVSIDCLPLIQKGLQLQGHPSGTAFDSEKAIAFAQQSGVKCQIEKYSLEDVDKAYDSMMSGKVRFRSVLVPGYKA